MCNVKIDTAIVEAAFARRLNMMVERIKQQGGVHDGHGGKVFMPDYIIMLASGEICPIFKGTVQCTNPLHIQRDGVWLSAASVAGPHVDWRNASMTIDQVITNAHRQFQESIDKYGTSPIVGWAQVR